MKDKRSLFYSIVMKMYETYAAKNFDYCDSFAASIREYGMVAALSQIHHKISRIRAISQGGKQEVKSESLKDTVLDLAVYCVILYLEVCNNKEIPWTTELTREVEGDVEDERDS